MSTARRNTPGGIGLIGTSHAWTSGIALPRAQQPVGLDGLAAEDPDGRGDDRDPERLDLAVVLHELGRLSALY